MKELAWDLRYITDLTELRLSGTEVTDDGMNELKPLALHSTLRRLDVSQTAVTRTGARRVNRALPDAEVIGVRPGAE